MELGHGWRGYRAVDVPIGRACVAAARATGARLVYLGTFHPRELAATPYVAAHEQVAREVVAIGGSVVRPTGIFATLAELRAFARRGVLPDITSRPGTTTNPIAEQDVARVIADAIAAQPGEVIDCGGPEVMTRREMFEQIAASVPGRVRIIGAPVWLARLGGLALSLVHPRIGQFVRFATGLARYNTVAPVRGSITLASYVDGHSRHSRETIVSQPTPISDESRAPQSGEDRSPC